jgi:hypothetical protein
MGKTQGPYNIEFPIGSSVRIACRKVLQKFLNEWQYHNKLTLEQLDYHDQVRTIEWAGIYHGGDELYKLTGVPGIWHEQCLEACPGG